MTVADAYKKTKRFPRNIILKSCADALGFWIFSFSEIPDDPERPWANVICGGDIFVVNKLTGVLSRIPATPAHPLFNAFLIASTKGRMKEIPISQFENIQVDPPAPSALDRFMAKIRHKKV